MNSVIMAISKIHNKIELSNYYKIHPDDWKRIVDAILDTTGDLSDLESRINAITPMVRELDEMFGGDDRE